MLKHLTEAHISACSDNKKLFELLAAEVDRRLPEGYEDLAQFVTRIRALPAGLRAMAATYQLDVSISLDSLGFHFRNWHHRPYCEETLRGLRELGADREAEIFAAAYEIVQPYWDTIGRLVASDRGEFTEWYASSQLERTLDPLNRRMWDLNLEPGREPGGILGYWPQYARKYPHKVLYTAS